MLRCENWDLNPFTIINLFKNSKNSRHYGNADIVLQNWPSNKLGGGGGGFIELKMKWKVGEGVEKSQKQFHVCFDVAIQAFFKKLYHVFEPTWAQVLFITNMSKVECTTEKW